MLSAVSFFRLKWDSCWKETINQHYLGPCTYFVHSAIQLYAIASNSWRRVSSQKYCMSLNVPRTLLPWDLTESCTARLSWHPTAELHHVRLPRPRTELLRRSLFVVQFLCLTLSLQKSKPVGLLWNLLSCHSLNFSSSFSSTFFLFFFCQCVWVSECCLCASPFILALGLLGAVSNK